MSVQIQPRVEENVEAMSRPTTPHAAAGPVPRIALWDDARLGLMVLVVFGHSIEGLRSAGSTTTTVDDVVSAFHMPAFLLISGWVTRAEPLDRPALQGTVKLVVTWLAAEAVWVGIRALLGKTVIPEPFLVAPSWTLWFLVTLVAMRVLLPPLLSSRPLGEDAGGCRPAGLGMVAAPCLE